MSRPDSRLRQQSAFSNVPDRNQEKQEPRAGGDGQQETKQEQEERRPQSEGTRQDGRLARRQSSLTKTKMEGSILIRNQIKTLNSLISYHQITRKIVAKVLVPNNIYAFLLSGSNLDGEDWTGEEHHHELLQSLRG